VLVTALGLGAALRIWLSFNDDGIYWPDEIYQSLEPAHRLVFGYGLVTWEFVEGARNWALPGFVAGLLKLAALLGLDDPRQYLSVVRVAFSAIGVATAFGSYFLARRLGGSPLFAACGATLFALVGPVVYFAPRAMAETASALPVVFGLALALPAAADRRQRIVGASLLGLAVMLRLQNAIFCPALLGALVARRQWREAGEATAALVCWAAVFGLLDKLTWGQWFNSAVMYFRFNVVLGAVPITGPSPPEYYVAMLFKSMPAAMVVATALAAVAVRQARGLFLLAAVFFLVHTLFPLKAYRYILPVLPLYGALAGLGLEALQGQGRRNLAYGAALALMAAALWSGLHFRSLTFGDVGPYEAARPTASALDDGGPANRLMLSAHGRPDLCGLKIETDRIVAIGGYSYLHRAVPLYSGTGPPPDSGLYNYVITVRGRGTDETVAEDGNRVLARLPVASCAPDPTYDWHLDTVLRRRD